jgi:hypothetical protein
MSTNPQPILYPLVNNRRWDFTSVSFVLSGAPLPGLVAIDYSQELKAGEIYANGSAQKIGATRGQLKPAASFDILAEEYENLVLALCLLNGTPGSGHMEVRWDLQVAKQDGQGLNLGPLFVDTLRGCKLNKVSKGYKTGPEGLLTKCELDLFYILENGNAPIAINTANSQFVVG